MSTLGGQDEITVQLILNLLRFFDTSLSQTEPVLPSI